MATAPLPYDLPGRFFVLAWDKNYETLILTVDDPDRSSYKLGDIATACLKFKLWGLDEFGARAVNQAREFGMVQAIPSQNRIINLFERPKPTLNWSKNENAYAQLPAL